MASLQRNKHSIIFVFYLFLQGCTTSSFYNVGKPNASGTEIKVSPDRIITECEFITDYDGDQKSPYGFMIHILDLQNTVITVSNGVVLEKEYCFERQVAVDKIIKNAQSVIVSGRGNAEAPIVKGEFKHTFKRHGTYYGNGRSLNFLAIWNNREDCYSGFNGEDDPCLLLNNPLNY